jgi:protein-tyrosine kinase
MSRIGDALRRAGVEGSVSVGASIEDLDLQTLPEELRGSKLPPAAVPTSESAPAKSVAKPEAGPAVPAAPSPDLRPACRLYEPFSKAVTERLVIHAEAPPEAIEQYRRLAALLHHTQQDRGMRTVMVASALAREGKTLTAANVALTLSESYRRRVLLMDADLRRPSLGELFGLANLSGLSEALQAADDRKLSVVNVSPSLSVLPAGRPMADPMHVLTSTRMRRIVEEASAAFDWVVIDTPPVALLTDANLLAAMVEGAILVVGANSTPLASVQRAMDAIGRERILGVLLNRVHQETSASGYYYSYHARYYARDITNGHRRRWFRRLFPR